MNDWLIDFDGTILIFLEVILCREVRESHTLYVYICVLCFKRVFSAVCSPMVREIGVQSQDASYQRLLKWYLMPSCLTLSNIRYVSRVRWNNPGKGGAPSPTPQYSSYWKGSLLVALDYGRQIYNFTYMISNKTGFLPNRGCVSTTLWMHHMNADKTHWEKAWQELHKNATSYTKQILEAAPHETAAVRPLTSYA